MKKLYTLTFSLLFISTLLSATDLYWVGGSGTWNDVNHWSQVSGGSGGYMIPDHSDNVFIDKNGVSEGDIITISEATHVNNLSITTKKHFTLEVQNGVVVSIDKELSFIQKSGANLVLNSSIISLPVKPDLKKTSSVKGGIFYISEKVEIWKNDKWDSISTQKAGHIAIATPTNPLCNGGLGSAIGSVTGGVGPFQYWWTGGTLGSTLIQANPINNLGAGTYTLIVIDTDDGSPSFTNFIIVEPTVVSVFFLKTEPSCVGSSDGAITANIFGGTPGTTNYNVLWSTGFAELGVTTSTISSLPEGPYAIILTDSNNCVVTRFDTLVDPEAILINAAITDVSCNGFNDGEITTNPTSGNGGPFTYLWTPDGEVSSSITNKIAGIYTVHVEDVNNCPKDTTIEILEPTILIASISSITHLLCNGDCSVGEAIVTPSGGIAPFTYQWLDAGNNPIPGYTDSTASNLCAGTYAVSITDANSCNLILNNIVITEPPVLSSVSGNTPALCNGNANGTVVVTPSGGTLPYSYLWLTNPGGVSVGTDSLIINLPVGTYDYTVTDANNCIVTGSETIAEPDTIGYDLIKLDLSCNGDANGQATVINVNGGDGNYSYLWQDAAMTTIGVTPLVTNLVAGSYSITVTDGNGCFYTTNFEIIEPPAITLAMSADSVSCFGLSDGAVHVVASGGTVALDYVYDWRDAGNVQVGTTADVTGLPIGTYTVTVTDDNNCTETASVMIEEPLPISIAETITDVTCSGDMDGAIDVIISGGTPNYTIGWTGPNGFTSSTQNIAGLEGGDYTITITDVNFCVLLMTYTVDEPTALVFTPTIVDVLCFGDATGSIQVVVSGGNGGYLYDWRDVGNIQISTTNAITNVVAGDYTLNVTDALACVHSETYTIIENGDILFNGVVTPITCFNATDGAIDIVPTGGLPGYTYSWIGPNGFTSSSQNLANLEDGTYDLTLTDQNLCTKDTSFVLVNPDQLLIAETITDVTCNGDMDGAIDIVISGGTPTFSTAWTGPNGFISTDQNISGLEGGDFTITVTDANNCVLVATYTVDEPLPITYTPTIVDVLCFAEATGSIQVVVSGGNGGYLYDWRDAGNIQISTTDAIANVVAGDYTLNVTDALGCTHSETYTINETDEIIFNGSVSDITCFGLTDGSITINPLGGVPAYTYSWVGPNGFTSISQNISNLENGDYTVTLTDQNLCSSDTTFTLAEPGQIIITETIVDVICNGDFTGEISIIVTGGIPNYLFDWTGPNGFTSTNQDITGLEAGDYTIIVTDNNNCTATNTYTVGEPLIISITPTITHILCAGDSTGAIQVVAAGGNGGYLYSWTGPNGFTSTDQDISGLLAGDYTLTVTDVTACSVVEVYTIDEPLFGITLTLSKIDIDCAGGSTGFVGVAISGGTIVTPADYGIEWYDASNTIVGTTQIVSNLPAGMYTVIVSDLNNCSATDSIEVLDALPIIVNPSNSDALCNGDASGSALVTPSGGTVAVDYTYEWESVLNPGTVISTTNSINSVLAGDYQITVSDDNGCSNTEIVTIGEPQAINVVLDIDDPLCSGDLNGQVLATVSGGTVLTDYSYEYQNDLGNIIGTNALITGLGAGNYLLIVSDDNNCIVQTPFTLNATSVFIFIPSIQQISCAGFDDGQISVNVSGETTPYSYEWTNEFSVVIGTDTIISNLAEGDYTFTATSATGCSYSETYTITPQSTVTATFNQYLLGDCSDTPPCTAAAAVVASGGTGIYINYQWIDDQGIDLGINSDTATGLCSGGYLVIITDSDGCTGNVLVLINDQTPEDIIIQTEDPVCNGNDGTAIAEYVCVDAPCSIEWFDALTNTNLGLSGDTVQLAAGDYFVAITNATGCTNNVPFSINEALMIIPNPTSTDASCNGICDGTATVTPSGGTMPYTYLWNDPAAQTTPTATGLCEGDYTVTITDANLCDTTVTISVMAPSLLTISETVTDVNCQGGNDGIIALVVTGGSGVYTYTWTPEPPIGNGTATGSGLTAGDYTIDIEDVNNLGCIVSNTYTVLQADSLLGTIRAVESSCGNNDGEASVVVTGGTPNYTFLWNDPAAQTTPTASNLFAGIYTVSVTDANLCNEIFTVAVNDQDADTLELTIDPGLCFGDSSTVTVTYNCLNPTCVITWYNEDGSTLPISGDVAVLPFGNYWVGIENGLGCSWYKPFELIGANQIEPNLVTTNETCSGPCDGTASVSPIGGSGNYTYLWTPEPPVGQGTDNVSELCAGLWQLLITDTEGCDTTITFEIFNYSSIDAVITQVDASCNGDAGGSASVIASGGNPPFSYLWVPEPGNGQGTANVDGLYAGDWMVTIADISGCDSVFTITILEPSMMEADSTVVNASCNITPGDGSINLVVSGGISPYTYQWFDASGTDLMVNVPSLTGLTEGVYYCVVVDDSLCTETFVAIVSEDSGEDITTGKEDVTCFGGDDGMAWVEYICGDAPCTVNWYDELGVDLGFTTDTISNLIAGSYIVGVTNASGCVTYENIVVIEAPEIVIDLAITEATCSGICDGTVTATVSGGTGAYTYLWTPEPPTGQGSNSVSELCAGMWTLEITDENGCMNSVDFEITEIDVILANIQIGNEDCEGDCNGWASVDPTGGTGDYSFLWTPEPSFGQGTDSVGGLCGGDWSVLITDLNSGCNLTELFTISQVNPIIVSDTTIVDAECENENSGSISITVIGGTSPYTYQWLDNNLDTIAGETDAIIEDLFPGAYFILITDDIGCTHSEVYVVSSLSMLTAYAGNDTSYCQGGGPATLIGEGTGVNSLWTDILGNVLSIGDTLVIDAPVGNIGYIYQTSDGICTASDTAYVVVLPSPLADAGPDIEIIIEESTLIGGDPTAGDGSIIAWIPSETLNDSTLANPIASPLVTTMYIVYVDGANTCIASDTMIVVVKPKFLPNNGFTPNGDGINDVWVIGDLTDFPNIEVHLYNRWGQLLFSSVGYDEPWDGMYNGKLVPIGTYYYVIDLKDEEYPEPFTGPLTIMR